MQILGRSSLLGGALLALWPVVVTVESAYAQWDGGRKLAQSIEQNKAANRQPSVEAESTESEVVVALPVVSPLHHSVPNGSLLGRFEVPRLELSYILLEGTDNRTLDRSIGHVEGTGMIGSAGNIGIAGHRNTHFRKLEWIRRDDEIVLTDPAGSTYHYRVEWTRVVRPTEIQVLDPSNGPAITLITCFPFEYAGAAPLRMIVRALPLPETRARVESSPDNAQAATLVE